MGSFDSTSAVLAPAVGSLAEPFETRGVGLPEGAGSRRGPTLPRPGEELDLRSLLPGVEGGDEESSRRMVEALHPVVARIVRAHLPRRAAEEDLVQEILVKVFQRLPQYRRSVPLEHWVSRIAVNHCRNAIRAQTARPEWRMADLPETQARATEEGAESRSHAAEPCADSDSEFIVASMLAVLEPRDRALIRWLEIDDLTVEEICARTGWSSTLVRVRAFRARRRLNARFHELQRKGIL
ncbi:MAG: polymerase sigma-E factor [Verrucomicrobiota bacterium]